MHFLNTFGIPLFLFFSVPSYIPVVGNGSPPPKGRLCLSCCSHEARQPGLEVQTSSFAILQVHPAAHTPTQQVVFYIGHGPLRTPAILCTKNLIRPEVPAHWHVATTVPNTHLLGVPLPTWGVPTFGS